MRFSNVARLLDLIFAEGCPACGRPAVDGLCDACAAAVAQAPKNVCALCGTFLAFDYAIDTGESYRCGPCRSVVRSPFEQMKSALVYENPAREAVHAFKFQGRRRLATSLAERGADTLVPWMSRFDDAVLVATPMWWRRLLARGYNPAWLLAERLSLLAGVPLVSGALVRTRDTAPQFGLNVDQRRTNVRGAFKVARPETLAGKTVILFDDVHTTGATAAECCKAIAKAEPARVVVATLFRTPNA
jgi:ComF family protein